MTRSFARDASRTVTLPTGQIVHEDALSQSERLAPAFYEVRPGVWCFVGNGLSNQTFVTGPEGIIAIDTGESVEEMREALRRLREHTSTPVVAVLLTHFHYVAGTAAVVEAYGDVPICGHERIHMNRLRAGGEVGPTYSRGLVEQFAIALPLDGPDGVVNVGLGLHFRNEEHRPFTYGYLAPTQTFDGATTLRVAGLDIEVTPAPSDADDSVTYWFKDLGVAVHNLVWPLLFNIFAIRGEEYRDPQVLLRGLDHLLSLNADYLVGTHGPPLRGPDVAQRVERYRDAIAYLWDQTVRHTNRGATSVELAHLIRLPDFADEDYLTTEFYGISEHHVRQIRSGLFGFFDGDERNLFPLPTNEHCARLIAGFGGRDEVRRQARHALDGDDVRWALELATWLVRSDEATGDDRVLLAATLRAVAQRTTAANIRNWCLTRARDLDGSHDLSRLREHRFSVAMVVQNPLVATIATLRVLLDPERAAGLRGVIAWHAGDEVAALHIRNCVAVPVDGSTADGRVHTTKETLGAILAGKLTSAAALADGQLRLEGDNDFARHALGVFDVASLAL
jgi:alkyl sulfatase BDS1-like metallo-beta-lactamase superfamily hydrolase